MTKRKQGERRKGPFVGTPAPCMFCGTKWSLSEKDRHEEICSKNPVNKWRPPIEPKKQPPDMTKETLFAALAAVFDPLVEKLRAMPPASSKSLPEGRGLYVLVEGAV